MARNGEVWRFRFGRERQGMAEHMPKRIQMRRDRPWRKENPDAVRVDRATIWGNPFRMEPRPQSTLIDVLADAPGLERGCAEGPRDAQAVACHLFEKLLRASLAGPLAVATRAAMDRQLRGKDLACWCSLDMPCHADILLRIANEEAQEPRVG